MNREVLRQGHPGEASRHNLSLVPRKNLLRASVTLAMLTPICATCILIGVRRSLHQRHTDAKCLPPIWTTIRTRYVVCCHYYGRRHYPRVVVTITAAFAIISVLFDT